MPIMMSGIYFETDDKPYEAESGYYIDFQIISALFSLENIMHKFPENHVIFKNKYQYYHYYCDHLIFSLGQIANRFIIKAEENGLALERKNANIMNFGFNKDKYPILSNKQIRNTIEHIDEHNQKVIGKYHGVGGFNLIDSDTDVEVVNALTANRKYHPYTLDLINKTLMIMRNDNELSLDLEELRNELFALQKAAKNLLSFAADESWRKYNAD